VSSALGCIQKSITPDFVAFFHGYVGASKLHSQICVQVTVSNCRLNMCIEAQDWVLNNSGVVQY
jgi:hypothetical protein